MTLTFGEKANADTTITINLTCGSSITLTATAGSSVTVNTSTSGATTITITPTSQIASTSTPSLSPETLNPSPIPNRDPFRPFNTLDTRNPGPGTSLPLPSPFGQISSSTFGNSQFGDPLYISPHRDQASPPRPSLMSHWESQNISF